VAPSHANGHVHFDAIGVGHFRRLKQQQRVGVALRPQLLKGCLGQLPVGNRVRSGGNSTSLSLGCPRRSVSCASSGATAAAAAAAPAVSGVAAAFASTLAAPSVVHVVHELRVARRRDDGRFEEIVAVR